MRIPKLNFKDQKWLYFFIGSLFTALLAGGLVYFDVYSVIGQSVLRSDPTMSKPALYAEGRSEVLGGIVTNTASEINQKAESGLIVLGGIDDSGRLKGKVGIGFGSGEVPQSMLDVKGDVKVDVSGTNSTSGLIVIGGTRYGDPIGRVGIGLNSGEIPSVMLEVKGNVKVSTTTDTGGNEFGGTIISPEGDIPKLISKQVTIGGSLRLNPDGLEHLEERNAGTYYYWAYGNCNCLEARRNESRLADARKFSLSAFSQAVKKYLNSLVLPRAWAYSSCFDTAQECRDAGGSYCVDYGDTCAPGQYDFEINCTRNPTADAQCDQGDTPVAGTEDYNSCYGTQYIGIRQCRRDSSGVDWFSKIRFVGSPSAGQSSQTIIDDDLVANNNVRSSCSWLSATQCSDGKFMAGYNSSANQIYCCEL